MYTWTSLIRLYGGRYTFKINLKYILLNQFFVEEYYISNTEVTSVTPEFTVIPPLHTLYQLN